MRWLFPVVVVLGGLLGALACPGGPSREICKNGVDDDKNGLVDCDDPDCAGQDGCPPLDAGYFGPCGKCGTKCTAQAECLSQGFSNDSPLPICNAGRCEAFNKTVEVKLEFDTTAWTGLADPRTMAVRVVSKKALDGTAVSCATLEAVATGKTAADANQLEVAQRYQYVGFDVRARNVSQPFAPTFIFPLLEVAEGSDYLMWIEVWGGAPNPDTKLPTGNRYSWVCDDSPTRLTPIIGDDNCPTATNPAGLCRTFHFSMPGPR